MVKIRVYYEDTDAGGIVYHSNYINFCERARSEHFFSRGMNPHLDNGSFVVRRIECDYLAPSKLGDLLEVKTKILEIKNTSLVLEQSVYKQENLLFIAKIVLVFVEDLKPAKIPPQMKELFKTFDL